ncbi:MAG: ribonuclease Y [Nitrospinota bacterium]|nr:ribonuclease Y [Nitrospinota bacterium]MDH5678582.1 ribonuclease Y [Nitrospinota bacterium]MDH5755641.1 ribonuclease Y [Nitrospinota bacterium]
METIVISVVTAAVGFVVGMLLKKSSVSKEAAALVEESKKILEQAKNNAATIEKEAQLSAKEEALKAQSDFESRISEKRNEIDKIEKRLLHRERSLDKRISQFEAKEAAIERKEEKLDRMMESMEAKNRELESLVSQQEARLEEIAGITADDAKKELKDLFYDEARKEAGTLAKRIEDEAVDKAREDANMIVALAVQRCSSDFVAENSVSVVDLPNEEMKGRIIGREGRNIRALEVATGVDLIIDDTPNAVILSSFDIVKREIARQTLLKLMSDGRIHPGRIEETVSKVTRDVNAQMKKEGERACMELGLEGMHSELIRLLGRLKYRTSYSQNVLQHSVEVGYLCGIMAAELKQNVKLARRAGLLHDLGKAVDQNMEGKHTQIGADLARKYNEPKVVINSIASHHEDTPAESIIAILVAAGDALSASRPGARREMLQNYINRMQKLEEIGDSFDGVEKSYAIQAGREIRVVVLPDRITDSEAFFLAKDIARKIESELAYPGEIKVTVIRETRVVESAR